MYLTDLRPLLSGELASLHSADCQFVADAHAALTAHLDCHPFGQRLNDDDVSRWCLHNPGLGTTIIASLGIDASRTSLSLVSDAASTVFTAFELAHLVRNLPAIQFTTMPVVGGDPSESVATAIERNWLDRHVAAGAPRHPIHELAYMPANQSREWYGYLRARPALDQLHPALFAPTPMLYREHGDPIVKRYVAWVLNNPSIFPACDLVTIATFDQKSMATSFHGVVEPTVFTDVLPEHRLCTPGGDIVYHSFDPDSYPTANWKVDLSRRQPGTGRLEIVAPSTIVSYDVLAPRAVGS